MPKKKEEVDELPQEETPLQDEGEVLGQDGNPEGNQTDQEQVADVGGTEGEEPFVRRF